MIHQFTEPLTLGAGPGNTIVLELNLSALVILTILCARTQMTASLPDPAPQSGSIAVESIQNRDRSLGKNLLLEAEEG